jgi:hypothetical protein
VSHLVWESTLPLEESYQPFLPVEDEIVVYLTAGRNGFRDPAALFFAEGLPELAADVDCR